MRADHPVVGPGAQLACELGERLPIAFDSEPGTIEFEAECDGCAAAIEAMAAERGGFWIEWHERNTAHRAAASTSSSARCSPTRTPPARRSREAPTGWGRCSAG